MIYLNATDRMVTYHSERTGVFIPPGCRVDMDIYPPDGEVPEGLVKMQSVHLVVGCPGSGKSWVCEKLKDKYEYVHHDGFIGHINQPEVYVKAILDKVHGDKPVLAEAPFSMSQIVGPLEARGVKVHPVFIQEKPEVLAERYLNRERKPIPQGHLTRQKTYRDRAIAGKHFMGTSSEVLDYLRSK